MRNNPIQDLSLPDGDIPPQTRPTCDVSRDILATRFEIDLLRVYLRAGIKIVVLGKYHAHPNAYATDSRLSMAPRSYLLDESRFVPVVLPLPYGRLPGLPEN